MKLEPLKQWICDECGEVIDKPEHGWLEWLQDSTTRKHKGFRIVHHKAYSPRKPDGSCYLYESKSEARPDKLLDMHLDKVTGDAAMPFLLMFVAPMPHLRGGGGAWGVKGMKGWGELARRLTIPYYEEARLYWNMAKADGFFDGANEIWPYLPDVLKEIIRRYGEQSKS